MVTLYAKLNTNKFKKIWGIKMELLEKDIEDIIYNSPWLLDSRFDIPNIKGTKKGSVGRQVNVGKASNRYIDLLFRDTRDNRPVIIELKKEALKRENIAQILEYRALVISMDEDKKIEWESEFGMNYHLPKLILIGTEASEEIRISANLAGIEIRTLVGEKNIEVDFNQINDITKKINQWNAFIKSGNRTLEDRDEWISEIFNLLKEVVEEDNRNICTAKKMYRTSKQDSWITDLAFPFINFYIDYKDKSLCGIFEYFNEEFRFSDKYIYVDFLIQKIYYSDECTILDQIKNQVIEIFEEKRYEIIAFESGIATIKLERAMLENSNKFKREIIKIINDAIFINEKVDRMCISPISER